MKAPMSFNDHTAQVIFRSVARQMKDLAETLVGLCEVLQADDRRKTQDLADDMLSAVYGMQKQIEAAHGRWMQESEAGS